MDGPHLEEKGAPPATVRIVSMGRGEKRVVVMGARTTVRNLLVTRGKAPQLGSRDYLRVKRRGDLGPAILDAAVAAGQEFLVAYHLC